MRALLLAATIAAAVVSADGAAAQTPAAPTLAGDMFLSGEWRLPASHRYEVYSPERGEYQVVDVRQVPAIIQSGVPVYDRTAQVWIFHPTTGRNPMYLASSPAPAPTTAPGMPSGWQRIHGTVQSVQGPTLTLRADDGR